MSHEKPNTMEPSPFYLGEGYQDWTEVNPAKSGREATASLLLYNTTCNEKPQKSGSTGDPVAEVEGTQRIARRRFHQ